MCQSVLLIILHLSIYRQAFAVRPAYEGDPDRCPFTNRVKINGHPSEMTAKSPGLKYFRRHNYSREMVPFDRASTLCQMYGLEQAEILDQDDYDEVIKIVKDTDWGFWISVKGKFQPQFGNYNFDFKLGDGVTKIGFHDFAAESYDLRTLQMFEQIQEGCVAVVPSLVNPSGVSWSKSSCADDYNILCQYPKSCYKKSDYKKDTTRPIRRLKPLANVSTEDSGYAISTMQATWPFAKQVCEDAGMSLVWFNGDTELNSFSALFGDYLKDDVTYSGKSFWTAGRFSPSGINNEIYKKLYWWQNNVAYEVVPWDLQLALSGQAEHSGGFLKKWGKDREETTLDKNEPYDEGLFGIEKCVDAVLSRDREEYFTSKCEQSLRYFICKNNAIVKQNLEHDSALKQSNLEYRDGDALVKFTERDCLGEITFAGQAKPECVCYNGVHGLMADIKCKPRLLVGAGCMKPKAKTSLHWKLLPIHIAHEKKPWIIVVYTNDEKQEMYNWLVVNIEEAGKRQILGAATFYFSGFDLYNGDTDKSNAICLIANSTKPHNEFYEYQVSASRSLNLIYFNYEGAECYLDIATENITTHQVANGKEECSLVTDHNEKNPNETESEIEAKEAKRCEEQDDDEEEPSGRSGGSSCDSDDIHDKEPISKKGKAEGDIEDINDNLNRQLLTHAIEMAFPHYSGAAESNSVRPRNTWIILDKLFELAKQTCSQMVKPQFLSRVMKYFRIAHLGENYEYVEFFSDSEMRQILTLLDTCHQRMKSVREMEVQVDSCTGAAWKVTLENRTGEVISRSTDNTGYQAVFHHHVIEATWDVIDLWNALCVAEFKSSYLLYHHLERGLEILFTDKLKKLWHFPDVNEDYYQKLLGPDESIQLINLDQCVQAIYKGNTRISRMGRPNRGRNTVVGQMIRNRLTEEKMKSSGAAPSDLTVMANGKPKASNITTVCVRGSTTYCHKKPGKGKGKGKKNKFVSVMIDIIGKNGNETQNQ